MKVSIQFCEGVIGMTSAKSVPVIGGALPPLLSVDTTRLACGGRGRGWVYERINAGDFETITDGSRRLIVTESVLHWIDLQRKARTVMKTSLSGQTHDL